MTDGDYTAILQQILLPVAYEVTLTGVLWWCLQLELVLSVPALSITGCHLATRGNRCCVSTVPARAGDRIARLWRCAGRCRGLQQRHARLVRALHPRPQAAGVRQTRRHPRGGIESFPSVKLVVYVLFRGKMCDVRNFGTGWIPLSFIVFRVVIASMVKRRLRPWHYVSFWVTPCPRCRRCCHPWPGESHVCISTTVSVNSIYTVSSFCSN